MLVLEYFAPLVANGSTMFTGYQPWLPFYYADLFILLLCIIAVSLYVVEKRMSALVVAGIAVSSAFSLLLVSYPLRADLEGLSPSAIFVNWVVLTLSVFIFLVYFVSGPDVVEKIAVFFLRRGKKNEESNKVDNQEDKERSG